MSTGPGQYEVVGRTQVDAAGTISELAGAIKDLPTSAMVRIGQVVAVQNAVGRKVQTDQTGSAWVARLEDSDLRVGDRVALLQQGALWLCLGRLNGEPSGCPIGTILPYAASSTPPGWLVCDGSAVSRTDYAYLYSLVGLGYGAGDGSTTFNLPNLQGRVPVGQQGLTWFMTTTGGASTVTLTAAQIPAHDHGSAGGHTHVGTEGFAGAFGNTGSGASIVLANVAGTSPFTSNNGAHTHASVGSGQSHQNMPPYLVINYIIRAL